MPTVYAASGVTSYITIHRHRIRRIFNYNVHREKASTVQIYREMITFLSMTF